MARDKPPSVQPPPRPLCFQVLKKHLIPFQDHTGNPAYMVFEGSISCPLPPLYSFAIYFTHENASSENLDWGGLLDAVTTATSLDFRLDLYFVPGAQLNDCIAHYHKEKAVREDYNVQLVALNRSSSNGSQSRRESRLPGLVPSYSDSPQTHIYRGLLYICAEPDWSAGGQRLRSVEFDPVSREEYDPSGDEAEPPRAVAVWRPINESSGSYAPFSNTVQMQMHEVSNLQRKNVTTEAWQDAVQRGWTSW